MGRHHGSNGLCFPLHIHEPAALGWQYSAFLYIGINGSWYIIISCLDFFSLPFLRLDSFYLSKLLLDYVFICVFHAFFFFRFIFSIDMEIPLFYFSPSPVASLSGYSVLVIVGVYTALFVSIRRTRTATPLAPNEVEIAVRFFFIVFTDCLCWMPTILLKMMSLANVYIPADLYGWLVVFVLPVNSAINPLLVTKKNVSLSSFRRQKSHHHFLEHSTLLRRQLFAPPSAIVIAD